MILRLLLEQGFKGKQADQQTSGAQTKEPGWHLERGMRGLPS